MTNQVKSKNLKNSRDSYIRLGLGGSQKTEEKMITVYHNESFLQMQMKMLNYQPAIITDKSLIKVAKVVTNSLPEAFKATSNINRPWHKNRNVITFRRSRSTGIGDVMQKSDGSYWLVFEDGFKQIQVQQTSTSKVELQEILSQLKVAVTTLESAIKMLNAFYS